MRVVIPEDEVELAEKTSSAKLIPHKPAGLPTLVDPLQILKGPLQCVIDGVALPHTRIGLQLGQGVQPSSYAVCTQFRTRLVELLRELAPASTYSGCDELLEDMKAVKTTKELELMHTAANVAAVGFVEAARCIRPGLRETDVAAAAQSAFETTRKAAGLPVRMYKAPPAQALTEEFYETNPKNHFARGFAIQTVGPLPVAFGKQMLAAKKAWGWGLREMMDYNHWAAFGLLGEILPWKDNRVTLSEDKDRFGLPGGARQLKPAQQRQEAHQGWERED